jgi:hypothetical protein
MLVSYSAQSSAPKIEATCSSEASVNFQRTTRRYIPADSSVHNHRCEIKSYMRRRYSNCGTSTRKEIKGERCAYCFFLLDICFAWSSSMNIEEHVLRNVFKIIRGRPASHPKKMVVFIATPVRTSVPARQFLFQFRWKGIARLSVVLHVPLCVVQPGVRPTRLYLRLSDLREPMKAEPTGVLQDKLLPSASISMSP